MYRSIHSISFFLGTTILLSTLRTGKSGLCINSYPLDGDTPSAFAIIDLGHVRPIPKLNRIQEAGAMPEGSEPIQKMLPYTYTYDQFAVFFYGDHVFVGGKETPSGSAV